jgi:hypothetical protein
MKPKIFSNLLRRSTNASYGGRGLETARLTLNKKAPRSSFYPITFDRGNDRKGYKLKSLHQLEDAWIQSEIV